MSTSFIGKTISLISHSDVRYRGVLAGIDPAAATIQLSNVYSMGTESRRPPADFIPPVQDPYQYIIFRASEVKDLSVDEQPPPQQNIHNDPAVLNAGSAYAAPYPPAQNFQQSPQPPAQQPQQRAPPPIQQQQQQQPPQPQPQPRGSAAAAAAAAAANGGSLNSAAASLQSVERALGDLRVTNGGGRGNANGGGRRRGGQPEIKAGDLRVPAADFDFQSSNARFDKAALAGGVSGATVLKTPKVKSPSPGAHDDDAKTNPSDESEDDEDDDEETKKRKEAEKESEKAYNPKASFFDSLSSSTQGQQAQGGGGHGGGHGGRGRGRGMGGRNRREEERERNVATFGEPGGLGLLGPGGYVPGWGGYGRRGGGQGQGGRGRRGGYYAGIGGR
ncbi:uncharacterized protein STEHIDRAFT_118741 [Stereum hirsutum FP-91666 SS1]|uniref:uncharacterized protein n=1 Tax=Stereum hirsutum (strain FP-91666) TaxID=721885 RepID=UPI000440FF7A|nr:uncharacterized protein STEHIDRAFT_118741 [Stereum hirsutum FP-91666 SS1]EIM89560.1 hypothetical protein STEHIDRAFT_118741 [Stereum hirsutum FP-91666 SS1]